MGWDAAMWLLDTSAPGAFVPPAPASPESPQDGPCSDIDHDYEQYLECWIAAVDAGEYDDLIGDGA